MSDPIKLPSPRQPVVDIDPETKVAMFSRPWFLFFQLVFQRIGGSVGTTTDELAPVDSGQLPGSFALSDLAQGPNPDFQGNFIDSVQALELRAVVGSLQDQVAELAKKFNDLQQGTSP
jgi:hypothetical protein